MSLLVVGSIAIDSIESPHGSVPEVLGGSATHFSLAASLYAPVRLVGVVGEDFPGGYVDVLKQHDVDLAGLQVAPGRSFRWTGRYEGAMAQAETLATELNVFGSFDPKVPESFRDSRFVFLANGVPGVQAKVLDQIDPGQSFTVLDTMNLWIETTRHDLVDVLGRVNGLVINDEEIRQLTGQPNLVRAGRVVLTMGPEVVIVKKGEHGALLFKGDEVFAAPAYPIDRVIDPTGAGDSFAGGFMGAIASCERRDPTLDDLRRAVVVGIVTSSFNVEDFGPARLHSIRPEEVEERYRRYADMLRVEGAPTLRQGASAT